RLHWIGVIGPVSATVSVVVLVIMGNQKRLAVPSTTAVVQVIQVESDSEDIQVSGQVAIYQPTGAAIAFSSNAGGLFYPDLTGLRGDKKTIVWTDFDKWEWENLEFSGGEVRCADIRFSMTARTPVRFSATFGPKGLTGSAEFGPLKPFRDAIVVASDNQFVAVRFDDNGNFHAQAADALAPNEFITSAILSDEQRRRQNVYRELFRREKTDLPQNLHQPMLLAWTDAVDVPLSLPDLDRESNSAIVVTPLLLQRPPPSQPVRIPAPFVTYRLIPDPGKPNAVGMTSAYSTRTRKWRKSMQATQAFLRFQIPRSIMPLQIERATMTLNIHSPSRLVKIVAFANGEATTLRSFESPSGTKQIVIQNASVLQLDDRGGFPIGILVERHPAELAAVSGQSVPTVSEFPDLEWHIESVSMELEGVAAEK
ncbi:MAG: hypothetical protein IH991_23255, partial [Planctomycetes bacterium]|nr:hypothetical protein [Planctomycetota bacterium]